jgi:hypothetical protein
VLRQFAEDHPSVESWRDCAEGLPVETRIKGRLVYELASDRVAGQSVQIAASALHASAAAEGMDCRHPWIDLSALEIAQQSLPEARLQ